MNWTLILVIYAVCMVFMLILMLCTKYKFDHIERIVIVALDPIMTIVGIISIIDLLIKHGPMGVLPRRKSKAYPLDKEDFRFWSKDTIVAGTEKMSIVDYNKKYGKSITLDDVYGQGYSESLTPEDIFECKLFIPKKFGLEPNMPDYIYKNFQ